MAINFDFTSIYEEETWTATYENAEGYQEKFYDIIRHEIETSNFPNLETTIDEFQTGGLLFNKEKTKMLKMKVKGSKFKLFEIYYRAQVFGNVVLFTRMECMEKGLWSSITGKSGSDLKQQLRQKCKNMAQYEEFVAIDSLANIVFDKALLKIDPNYKERISLQRRT